MRRIEELLGDAPALRRPRRRTARRSPAARATACFDAGRDALARGRAARTRSSSSAQGAVAIETSVPGRGPVDGRDAATRASCSAGRGWCRRTAAPSTRARSSTTHAIALDGACLRGKCDADPALGYDLLKLRRGRASPSASQDTRLRLLDLYGAVPADCAERTAGPWLPRDGHAPRDRTTPGRSRLEPRDGPAPRRSPPGQFAMLYAFGVGRGADLDQRRPDGERRSSTPSAPSARSPGRCAPPSPATCSACAGPFGTTLAAARRPRPRRRPRRRRHRARAAAARILRALLADRGALRPGHPPLRRPHARRAALHATSWRAGARADVDVERDRRRADGRLARVASASSRR